MRNLLAVLVVVGMMVATIFGVRNHLIGELRKPVLSQLNDPDSALFRNEVIRGPWKAADSTLCGELNARNKMGGYVGYKKFYVALGDIVDIDADPKMYEIMCEKFDEIQPWWWLKF
ncbi:hypothetical protein [Comamonas sp.]|uniref:hypothetical protein n=1 Tax=Comamonas sp. TaxID=34028 RepID=UPI003A90E1B3